MAFQGDSIFWVEVEKIVPNPFQPRREFDEDKLRELAESIRMYGVLQPLTVTRKEIFEDDGSFRTEYELIAGERRLRASRLAGLEQVPVLIRSGEQTEQEKLELAIIENLQREDLNAVDRALAFKQLADMFTLSHADVARKVGRSREYVSNSIRLLGLPDHMLDSLRRNEMSEGHARTLLMLKERPEEQDVVFREILLKKLSVREVERIARKIATDKVRKKEWQNTDAHLIEMERAFTDTLGTRVQISKTDFGGKLTIDYFSENDLEKLLKVIKQKENVWNQEVVAPTPETEASGETVIRTMDEMVAPLQDIVDATPLEAVMEAAGNESEEIQEEPGQPIAAPESQPMVTPSVMPAGNPVPSPSPEPVVSVNPPTAESVEFEAAQPAVVEPPETPVPEVQEAPVSVEEVEPERPYAHPSYVPPVVAGAPVPPLAPPAAVIQPEAERIMTPWQPVPPPMAAPAVPPPAVAQVPAPLPTPQQLAEPAPAAPAPVKPKDDDDSLYSMRNFSL